jgi:L-amino acid N-acyltransferase
MEIRNASAQDLSEILAIYNDIIATSTAVFATEPVTVEDRRTWMRARQAAGYPVLVATSHEKVTGFASFAEFRGAWNGYRYSVEHSVHVHSGARGRGVGSALVRALFPCATELGKHVIVGGIDAANTTSRQLHERLGFELVATLPEVGRKFGRWIDLVFMQKFLDERGSARAD